MNDSLPQHSDPLLLPFLLAKNDTEAQREIDYLIEVAMPIIRRRTFRALYPEDARQQTVQNILEWLRASKAGTGGVVHNYRGYVSTAAAHAMHKQLCKRYPMRRALSDEIRHAVKNDLRLHSWKDKDRHKLCGLASWNICAREAHISERSRRLSHDLSEFVESLPPESLRTPLNTPDLLEQIFLFVQHPMELNDLVRVIAAYRGIHEVETGEVASDGRALSEWLIDTRLRPDEEAELAELVRQVWQHVEALSLRQKAAYLLNFTAGDGQLDLFVSYQAATMRRIGQAIELTEAQFAILWKELGLSATTAAYDERFAALWNYLPLADKVIGRLLDATPQQVIKLRKAAGECIAQAFHRGRAENGQAGAVR